MKDLTIIERYALQGKEAFCEHKTQHMYVSAFISSGQSCVLTILYLGNHEEVNAYSILVQKHTWASTVCRFTLE